MHQDVTKYFVEGWDGLLGLLVRRFCWFWSGLANLAPPVRAPSICNLAAPLCILICLEWLRKQQLNVCHPQHSQCSAQLRLTRGRSQQLWSMHGRRCTALAVELFTTTSREDANLRWLGKGQQVLFLRVKGEGGRTLNPVLAGLLMLMGDVCVCMLGGSAFVVVGFYVCICHMACMQLA